MTLEKPGLEPDHGGLRRMDFISQAMGSHRWLWIQSSEWSLACIRSSKKKKKCWKKLILGVIATGLQHTPVSQNPDVKITCAQTLVYHLLLKCLIKREDCLSSLEFLVQAFEFHTGNCSFLEGTLLRALQIEELFSKLRLKLNSATVYPYVLFEAVTIMRDHLTSLAMWTRNTACETRFQISWKPFVFLISVPTDLSLTAPS